MTQFFQRAAHSPSPFFSVMLLTAFLFCSSAFAQSITEIADGVFGCYEEDGVTSIVRLWPDDTYSHVSYSRVRNRLRTRISSLRASRAKARDRGRYTQAARLRGRILTLRARVQGIVACWNEESLGGGGGAGGGGGGGGSTSSACDIIGDNGSFAPRIINGDLCRRSSGDSPVLYLELLDRQGETFSACTGSLVKENVVITAAHCLNDGVAGVRVISPKDSVLSHNFTYHAAYMVDDDLSQEAYDVGVVILPRKLKGTRVVSLLPTDNLTIGEKGIIAGYGLTEKNDSGDLRAGYMTIAAKNSLGIAAYYNGTDSNTCSGDSGGPILVKRGSTWFVAGLTSWGELQRCGPGDVSYFANINAPSVRSFLSNAGGL